MKKLSLNDSVGNNRLAFSVAEEHLGIASLIKPTEMEKPDRLALVTYLSLFYELFHHSRPVTPKTTSENTLEVLPSKINPTNTKDLKEVGSSVEKSILSPASSTKEQDIRTEKPVHSIDMPATSAQKSVVIPVSQTANKKHETSHKQLNVWPEKKAVSAEKEKSVKKLETLPVTAESVTCARDQTTTVESQTKKKKKKRKFRIFRRKKKNKSLATSTPSVERYVYYMISCMQCLRKF